MTESAETRWESHNEAGRRLFSQGHYAAAEQEFIAAMREANSLGKDDVRLASSIASLAQIKYLQKEIDQAEALFKRALAIRERHLGEKHPEVAVTLNSLARLYFRRNDFVSAAPLLMRLLAIKQESLGAHHPEVAVILTSLAKVRLAEQQYEDAEQLARRALLIREGIHQASDPAVAISLETLADVLAARGLLEEEQQLRKRVTDIRGSVSARGGSEEGKEPQAPAAPAGSSEKHASAAKAPAKAPAKAAAPPPAATSAHAAPAAPTAPPRTTRSASLPWIEPPTSPALRRPVPRPFSTTSPGASPAGASGAAKAAPSNARHVTGPHGRSTPRFVAQYPQPAAQRTSDRPAAGAASEPVTGQVRGPLLQPATAPRESHNDARVRTRRRSYLGFAIAAVVLAGGAGGAWFYLNASPVTTSAGAALDPLPAEGGASARGDARVPRPAALPAAGAGALTASPDPSYGTNPPERQKPPAEAYSDDPPAGTERLPAASEPRAGSPEAAPPAKPPARPLARRGAASAATSAPDTATAQEPPAPAMPAINVDRITSAIGDNARAKADSLGRKTMTVKPPDFQKP